MGGAVIISSGPWDGKCLAEPQPNSANPELNTGCAHVTLAGIYLTVIRTWMVPPTLTPKYRPAL